jgi:hypothetical protein
MIQFQGIIAFYDTKVVVLRSSTVSDDGMRQLPTEW